MLAPIVLGDPRAFSSEVGPGSRKENASTRKAKASVPTLAQALWRSGVSGPSPFEGTRDREPPSAYAWAERSDRQPRLGRPSGKSVSIFASGFLAAASVRRRNLPRDRAEHPLAGLDPFAVRADTRRAAPRCSDDGLDGEVSDGVCAGPISTAIVRYLPASPGSCQRVEEPQ